MARTHVLYHDERASWLGPGLTALVVLGLAAVVVAEGDLRKWVVPSRPLPERVAGEPAQPPSPPPLPAPAPLHEIRIPANQHKQFWLSGTILGTQGAVPVHFLIDTGASDTMIPKDVAMLLGLRDLRYVHEHDTANGRTKDAPTRLNKLEVGGIAISNFPADVSGGKNDTPVLGMTWLSLFDVRMADGLMTLTPKNKG